jgi:hypothetical protein
VSHIRTVALGIKFFSNATPKSPVPYLEFWGARRDRAIEIRRDLLEVT